MRIAKITELYRGQKQDNMHARIKVEIVVCEVPVSDVVDKARKVLNTGQPGDGKIFIYELKMRLRSEQGRGITGITKQ